MGYGYVTDLRERVLAYVDAEHGSKAEAAKVFGVARSTVYNWLVQRKRKGHVRPVRRGLRKRCLDRKKLLSYLRGHADAYLQEIGQHFGVSGTAVFKACKRWKITRKKNLILQRKKREKEKSFSPGTGQHRSG